VDAVDGVGDVGVVGDVEELGLSRIVLWVSIEPATTVRVPVT
jgi:hypothetical protein